MKPKIYIGIHHDGNPVLQYPMVILTASNATTWWNYFMHDMTNVCIVLQDHLLLWDPVILDMLGFMNNVADLEWI
jgi:hypothetical protein